MMLNLVRFTSMSVQKDELKECTFHPHLEHGKGGSRPLSVAERAALEAQGVVLPSRSSSPTRETQQAFYERIAQSLLELEEHRMRLKVEREMAGCTFHPQTNPRDTPRHYQEGGSVVERLIEKVC
jgi:hypothetical protein